jgi:hypothetical protein
MFDGGGPGRSGGPFQGGGLLSAIGNALTGNRGMGVGPEAGVGFAGYGYNDAQGNWVPAYIDMRNGGGPGRAGNTFMGGGSYSAIANMLGIRPMGYNDMTMTQEEADAFRMANMNKGPKAPTLSDVLASAPAASTMSTSLLPRPDGIGATPVTAYVAPQGYAASGMNPANSYVPYNAPAVVPAQITPNDYYSALLSQMQRFR